MPGVGPRVSTGRSDSSNVDNHRSRNPGRSNGRSCGSNVRNHCRSNGGYFRREDRDIYYNDDLPYNNESDGNWRNRSQNQNNNNGGKTDPDVRSRNHDSYHGRPFSPHRASQADNRLWYGRLNSHLYTGGGHNDSHFQSGQAKAIDWTVGMSTLQNPTTVEDEPSTITNSSNTVISKQRTMADIQLKPRSDNKKKISLYQYSLYLP